MLYERCRYWVKFPGAWFVQIVKIICAIPRSLLRGSSLNQDAQWNPFPQSAKNTQAGASLPRPLSWHRCWRQRIFLKACQSNLQWSVQGFPLKAGFKGYNLLISITLQHITQINLFHPLDETCVLSLFLPAGGQAGRHHPFDIRQLGLFNRELWTLNRSN